MASTGRGGCTSAARLPYLTRALLRTPITPNGVTWLMIASGLAAAGVLCLPGVLPAVAAFLLIQLQILLDCSDGELARWRNVRSTAGIYLDRIGHWLTETALPIALGIRAEEPMLGLVVAVLVLLIKGESALVTVARADAGLPPAADTRGGRRAPRRPAADRAAHARAAAVLPRVRGDGVHAARPGRRDGGRRDRDLDGSRVLVIALVPVAAITAVGHLVAILASDRLR